MSDVWILDHWKTGEAQRFPKAGWSGVYGAIFSSSHSNIVFDQNSITTFNDNRFHAIYSEYYSKITFKGNCRVEFSSNIDVSFSTAIYSH